jgi:hypothetical protein
MRNGGKCGGEEICNEGSLWRKEVEERKLRRVT